MFFVLLAVAVVGFFVNSMIFYKHDEDVRRQAYAAGWHLAQISKAARVYVRNNSATNPGGVYGFANLEATGSVEVPIQDLIDEGYLPPGFSAINAFDQTVRVFAALYPVVAPPGPANPDINIPTAYVVTDNDGGNRATGLAMTYMMQGAREAGMSASAPLFAGGANLSENCGGTASVMIWDTGCLNAAQIATVTGGAVAVAEGQLIVPAWKSVQHDVRAVMRFPQPENPGFNVMSTNLHMGNIDTGAALPDAISNQAYYLPDVYDHGSDTLTTNNRRGITNVGNLNVSTLILNDQGNDANGTDQTDVGGVGDEDNLFTGTVGINSQYSLAGNHQQVARVGSLIVNDGNLTIDTVGPLTAGLEVFNNANISVTGAAVDGFGSVSVSGNADIDGLVTAIDATTSNLSVTLLDNVDTFESVTMNTTNINASNEIIAQNLNNAGTVTTTGQADIVGALQSGNALIEGSTTGTPAGTVRTQQLTTAGNASFSGAMTFNGNLDSVGGGGTITNLTVRRKCFGDCPGDDDDPDITF